MNRLVVLMLVAACGGNEKPTAEARPASADSPSPIQANDPPGQDDDTGELSPSDTAEDDQDDTGPGDGVAVEASSTLQRVASGSFGAPAGAVTSTWANPINGYTYILNDADGRVYYLTEARNHPTGDWCISPTCDRYGVFTSGRIVSPDMGRGMCTDLDRGQLYLAQDNVEVRKVDVDPRGDVAETYQRVSGTLALPSVLTDFVTMDGPCTYLSSLDALLVTDTETALVALVDVETGGLRKVVDDGLWVDRWIPLADGVRVVGSLPKEQALAVVSLPDLDVVRIDVGAPVSDISLDEQENRLYIAHGQAPGLSVLSLDDPLLTVEPIPDAPDAQYVATSPDGAILASVDLDSGGDQKTEIVLIEDDVVVDQVTLYETVRDIVEPFSEGDFTVVVEDWSDQLGFVSYDVRRATQFDDRPPLHVFVMAAIEQPNNDELEALKKGTLPCTAVHDYVDQIRSNAVKLSELDIGLAVAVTANFAQAAALCDRLSVFEMLANKGFSVGYMVHRKPTYHCTDTPGTTGADVCSHLDTNYCSPETDDCSFPGDEEYCDLGDQDCYQRYLDQMSVESEPLFGSRPAFVLGADRHGMWEWDWVQGYQNMLRADGSRGYDTTGFNHLWAYSDQISFSDSRGKNDGPWDAYLRSEAWAMEYLEGWDVHSAFSDLVYMPGVTTSLIKLGERYSTGLYVIDLLKAEVAFRYGDDDFETLWQLLRNAINHRGRVGPNVWYFHLQDLTTPNLVDGDGEVMQVYAKFEKWADDVNRQYVASGEVVWSDPSKVRQLWSETR